MSFFLMLTRGFYPRAQVYISRQSYNIIFIKHEKKVFFSDVAVDLGLFAPSSIIIL